MSIIGSSNVSYSRPRHLHRDSNGNLIAVVPSPSSNVVVPYISSDDGSSWTQGNTTFTHDNSNNYQFGVTIDSADAIHLSALDPSDNSIPIYHKFTIGTGGGVSTLAADEQINSYSYNIDDSAITVTSGDTPVVAHTYPLTDLVGTTYEVGVARRDGAGSWTIDYTGETTNHYEYSIVMDSADFAHIIATDYTNSDLSYNIYDVSGNSLTIESEGFASGNNTGNLVVTSADEPIVPVGNTLYRYDSSAGSWNTDQYTTDTANRISVGYDGGDLWVVYQNSNDNIRENHASGFGNFDTANVTDVVTTADATRSPTTRWHQYNDNDPATTTVDLYYYNATQSDARYEAITLSKSVTETLTAVMGTTPTDHANMHVRRIATALMETGGE